MNENQIDYFLINNLNKKNENGESDFYRGTFTLDEINNSDEIKLKNLMVNQSFCFISNSLMFFYMSAYGFCWDIQ